MMSVAGEAWSSHLDGRTTLLARVTSGELCTPRPPRSHAGNTPPAGSVRRVPGSDYRQSSSTSAVSSSALIRSNTWYPRPRNVVRERGRRPARQAQHERVDVRRAGDRREDPDADGAEMCGDPTGQDGENQEEHGEKDGRAELERVTELGPLCQPLRLVGAAAEVESEPAGGACPHGEAEKPGGPAQSRAPARRAARAL